MARRASGLAIEEGWMKEVTAEKILRFGTQLEIFRLVAGGHQHEQLQVDALPLSGMLRLLAETPASLPARERMRMALLQSGWQRPLDLVCCVLAHTHANVCLSLCRANG